MTTYKFIGEGEGVPGLPHEITDEEAAALGVSDVLKAAVENGSYVEHTSFDYAAKSAAPLRTKGKKESE